MKMHYQIRNELEGTLGGSTPVPIAERARVLLLLDQEYGVCERAEKVRCGAATVKRIRRKSMKEAWQKAIGDGRRP